MPEAHMLKRQRCERGDGDRIGRPGFFWSIQNILEILEGGLGLTVHVDHIPQFLQRSEDKEGVDPEGEKLPEGDLLGENQIEHQAEDARPEKVDRRSLDKAQAPEITDLLQFQLQDLLCRDRKSTRLNSSHGYISYAVFC